MSDLALSAVVFLGLWAITFLPAWWLLLRLIALSASPRRVSAEFWGQLIVYRIIIALPYLGLLVYGEGVLPDILKGLVIGVLVAGTLFSVVRLYFRDYLVKTLWWVYGFFYDGLMYFAPYRRLVTQVVNLSKHAKPDAKHVLELGCGTGNVLRALADEYPNSHLTGVDISVSMLRVARKKLPAAYILRQDVISFLRQQPDKMYDLVVMQNVLYAIPQRDELWRLLNRVLRQGGAVVVTNSDRPGSSSITREHLKFGKWYELLYPKLLIVGVIDNLISQLSKTGSFHFVSESVLRGETEEYFKQSSSRRVYGDVNLLFYLSKK